jgi:ribonucleoside-diphosphate reductase alpha chain
MTIFDKSTEVVKQGGTRRGANMGILRYDHPDIRYFIHAKEKTGLLDNFNVSVAIDEKFMKAVREDKEYELINPKDGEVKGKLKAKEVWQEMIQTAWATGDPGFVVIDRINKSDSNPTPKYGQIESTNPCGEQPLLPYEPCNLGSISLVKLVDPDLKDIDFEKLRDAVFNAVHFLDNVIDVNNYPLPRIEFMAKMGRRIGLGVMGWAEALVMMGIPYNSQEAIKKAEEVIKFINEKALEKSENIAKEKGVFPYFKDSIYDKEGKFYRGKEAKPRNSARTTIAPTGTIAITAGLQGSGIEPFFAIAYVRYNAKALDKVQKGETPDEQDTFFEVNSLFRKIAKENNFFGMKEKELWKKIEDNHKAVKGIKEIPEEIQNLFLTSHDLTPMDHVNMQIAFQKHTNNAVSKTVNLKNEATKEDVEAVYNIAYEKGVKGVTIYRDGSKQFQVLNLEEKDKKKEEVKRGIDEKSSYYEVRTGQGPLHIHINYDEIGPTKLFVNLSPAGTEISGLTTALGILISKFLEANGEPTRLIKHLNSIKGDKSIGFGQNRVDSIPHGIAKALRDHLIKTGQLQLTNGQTTLTLGKTEKKEEKKVEGIYCPQCYSSNVEVLSGCSGPTCYDCGYSECS